MKDLAVKYRADNKCYCINAARVGLSDKYGSFATEKEAVAEAEKLKAKFVLGRDMQADEKPKLFSIAQAISEYLANQILLQKKPYHEAQKFINCPSNRRTLDRCECVTNGLYSQL